jgi:hypothetical protein
MLSDYLSRILCFIQVNPEQVQKLTKASGYIQVLDWQDRNI